MTKVIKLKEVIKRTAKSKSSIYLGVAEGTFPKPISLGARAVGWIDQEVTDWINQRIAESQTSVKGDN